MLIHGNGLDRLSDGGDVLLADPPDNIGLRYVGYVDKVDDYYGKVLGPLIHGSRFFRVSYIILNEIHLKEAYRMVPDARLLIWHYTFGQHNQYDLTRSFRPILRIGNGPFSGGATVSDRWLDKDKRVKSPYKSMDDVFCIPRVRRVGWVPTQLPLELVVRLLVNAEAKNVTDPFAGSGTTGHAARIMNIPWTLYEISKETYEKTALALSQ